MSEWQPIETAPRGTLVLVYDGRPNYPILVAQLEEFSDFWEALWDDRNTDIRPTHWMPLPPPPATQEPKP